MHFWYVDPNPDSCSCKKLTNDAELFSQIGPSGALVVERFEGEQAVCETDGERILVLPRQKLPQKAKAGDVLIFSKDGKLILDAKETLRRKTRINSLQDELFKGFSCE